MVSEEEARPMGRGTYGVVGMELESYPINEGKTVTLVVAEGDPGVAATWSAKSVTLTIKATAK